MTLAGLQGWTGSPRLYPLQWAGGCVCGVRRTVISAWTPPSSLSDVPSGTFYIMVLRLWLAAWRAWVQGYRPLSVDFSTSALGAARQARSRSLMSLFWESWDDQLPPWLLSAVSPALDWQPAGIIHVLTCVPGVIYLDPRWCTWAWCSAISPEARAIEAG